MTRQTFLASLASIVLLAASGCAGGYRVVRSAAEVDLAPGAIALVHEAPDDAHEAAFASAFTETLDDVLPPAFVLGDATTARYRLHLRDMRVANTGDGVRGAVRLALRDATGSTVDVVDVEATEADAAGAGVRAAEHFGRFLRERRQHAW